MKINVLSTHRFHLLDLARELSSQGHDVLFYSYVPKNRCAEFGIDKERCKSLLWLVWPFFVLERFLPHRFHERVVWYRNALMDWFLSVTMRHCDVCIGIGTVYVRAFEQAKTQGAVTILEWGSKHIVEQQKMFGTLESYPKRVLARELLQYQLCDYISIPTTHVRDSFVRQGVPVSKLWVNPYGVDLTQFYPKDVAKEYDLIYVGGWRYEKGCDLLIDLCKQYGYSLLHVGSLVNMDFPQLPNVHHHDSVHQNLLVDYYAKARVFVLPSRSEGLAMVQAQALACGLPVVCSKETGGRDLQQYGCPIIEIERLTIESLHDSVTQALHGTQDKVENNAIEYLKWKSYGTRYSDNLRIIG